MRTSAQLFATIEDGQTVDLAGETFDTSDVDKPPKNVIVTNGIFRGQTQMWGPVNIEFAGCHFIAGDSTTDHGLLRMLGGNEWKVTDCVFTGGVVDAQLGVGLNLRVKSGYPKNWTISGCDFEPLDGQWGNYPQGHQIYVLADPNTNINGKIDNCIFSGSPYGAPLKLGGTGNQPHTEGTRGVLVTECSITGRLDHVGRVLGILTQGEKTDVTIRDCVLQTHPADGGVQPWIQGMDGARCRMEAIHLPQGVIEYATWFQAYFVKKEKKVAVPAGQKPPTVGGITWA